MAIDLLNLEETGVTYDLNGLKILIYGGNTLGKTPQSMKFPKPLLLMGESGGSALKGLKIPISKKKEFLDVVKQLTDEKTLDKMKEKYQTIILDTVEDIIEIFETAICQEYGCKDVGEIQQAQRGNPNGYSVYRREFKQQINLLCKYGYTVIFIAHEETIDLGDGKTFIQPKGSKGDKSSARFIRDLCDFRFYITSNGIDKETNKTIMSTAWCVQTEDFYAGSRYDIVPIINPFTAENVIKEIKEAQRKSAENYGADMVSFQREHEYTKAEYLEEIKPYMLKLYKLYPEEVKFIIESQLGEDAKVSDAKETQIIELESIYNNLVILAEERNIDV